MPRRPIGKIRSASGSLVSRSSGRRVSGLGALIVAIAAVPAWWTLGGGTIPEISGNAFDSPGAIGFFAALVVLAILLLLGSIANTLNPPFMKGIGFSIDELAPVSSVAGLVPPVERSPCRPGSV